MKFSCERCGKRYATAEAPSPGKVYKLKCKACGHLIVVRAPAAAAAAAPAAAEPSPGGAPSAASPPSSPPSPAALTPPPLPAAPPEPAVLPPLEIAAPGNGAPPHEAELPAETSGRIELETPTPSPVAARDIEIQPLDPPEAAAPDDDLAPTPTPAPAAPRDEAPPPAGDGGYIDLFSDLTPSATDLGAAKKDDPFLRALAEPHADAPAPDPFPPARSEPVRAPEPALKIPDIPKPPPQRSGLPIALIAAGVAVLVGILAFVLLGSGKKAPAASASPPPAARAQAQPVPLPPPPPVAPPPVAAPPAAAPPAAAAPAEPPKAEAALPAKLPAAAEPATEAKPRPKAADDDRRRREERRRKEQEAQAARDRERRAREEAAAKERDAAKERARRDAAERDRKERERVAAAAAAAPEEPVELTPAQIESVIRSTKKAFDGCIQSARGNDAILDGRRVMLRLNIQGSGTVTYPTLDDVTLNATEVGSCLKSAARLMVFPRFRGETMHVEVPLVMR